jgi:hypothetical protein
MTATLIIFNKAKREEQKNRYQKQRHNIDFMLSM